MSCVYKIQSSSKLAEVISSKGFLPVFSSMKSMKLKPDLWRLRFSIFFLFFYLLPSFSLSANDALSVYEILPKFGLPSGLLPDSVSDYNLSSDGRFVVVLPKTCYVQFDYLVYYDQTISGKLGYGSITDLKGIQVQRFFLWFDVDEIRVDLPPADCIYFHVGVIDKKLDIDQFKTVHSCRDGASKPCLTSLKQVFELPNPANKIQMLITE